VDPTKIKFKTFHPSNPSFHWKLWVRTASHEGRFYHIYWRRICVVIALLFLAGWLAVACAAWANIKYRRGFSEARYLDLAVPWRWGRYRAAVGAHYLALGRLGLKRGDPDAALTYLNASLALAPGNLESRRLAALAQYRIGFKASALSLLRAGAGPAAAAGDETFLREFFDVAFDLQADDEAFTVGCRLLPPKADGLRIHRLIALQVAMARYNRGHYVEAQQILADWNLGDSPEGEVLFALCYAERGMREIAVRRLEGDLARFEKRNGIYVALERLAREQGLPQEVLRYALLREMAESADPQARIDLIYAYHALARSAEVQREINSFCADFGSDANALAMLAQFAADTGEPDAAERARDLAQARGFFTADFALRIAQASIVAGDYRRAVRTVALAQSERQSLGRAHEAILAGLKAVALFGAGDGGAKLAFSDFLPLAGALRAPAGLFLVDQLRRAGFAEQSRQLLEKVCAEHPDDQPALTALIRSDAAAGNRAGLIANLPRILRMRKPAPDALEASLQCLDPATDAALRFQVTKALADSPAGPLSNGP
jgi:hypothetical protein